MTQTLSSQRLTVTAIETPPDSLRLVTCPMCHTPHASLTTAAFQAGGDWRCARCGQQWDVERVRAVTTYAAWAAEHDRV